MKIYDVTLKPGHGIAHSLTCGGTTKAQRVGKPTPRKMTDAEALSLKRGGLYELEEPKEKPPTPAEAVAKLKEEEAAEKEAEKVEKARKKAAKAEKEKK